MLPLPLTLLSFLFPVTLSAAVGTENSATKLRGVVPARRGLYTPTSSGTWKCLSGDKEISWAKVNDDFCDCPDGSDEPGLLNAPSVVTQQVLILFLHLGTSACPNSSFYCVNEGHEGASISSTRVNDGLCEKECCDGSDEPEGVCPNVCEEVGKEYRQRKEAEAKLRRTGGKIRSTYVLFAEKEKKRLQASIITLKSDVEAKKKEVNHAKILLDHAESMSQASLAYKQKSRMSYGSPVSAHRLRTSGLALYQSLVKHTEALKSLQAKYKALEERERSLSDVLRNLKGGYNPNYQDMAVLEAVRGWDGLNPEAVPAPAEGANVDENQQLPVEDEWNDASISALLNEDTISLLLKHEAHVTEEDSSEEGPYLHIVKLNISADHIIQIPSSISNHMFQMHYTRLTKTQNRK
ncbi:hypothetical protein FRC19_000918 [Serendipita sp. 401]|nr:hypothetical protein FRC19_000918 [Serendipita sp. 401]